MAGRTESTRERILATAEGIILNNGYAATSLSDIVAEAAITKGGFFYHFQGKRELARALVIRYLDQDDRIFRQLLAAADAEFTDPLQQLTGFLDRFSTMMAELESTHPGCLVVSFTYESEQLDSEIQELIRQGVLAWRRLFLDRLERIATQYTCRVNHPLTALADMFTAMVEGGIILSRIFVTNQSLVEQIQLYRDFLQLAFAPKSPVPKPTASAPDSTAAPTP